MFIGWEQEDGSVTMDMWPDFIEIVTNAYIAGIEVALERHELNSK